MSLTPLITLAAAEAGSGLSPELVGGGIFLVLMIMLGALVAFGGGRDDA